ncbi:MAG: hypothetical protein ACK2UM_02580 [Anaerolineales bacterium]
MNTTFLLLITISGLISGFVSQITGKLKFGLEVGRLLPTNF